MTMNFVYSVQTASHAKYIQSAITACAQADTLLKQLRDNMVQMLGGDGSNDAHYSDIATRFGFASNLEAHNAFTIIDTAYQKTAGNGSVTSSRDARDQLFSQLRT